MLTEEKDTEIQIIPHDSSAPIDMLGREDFIGQLVTIVEILASNKKNASYAINGAWGTGKTWILESFERRIREFYQEGTTLNKYVVFTKQKIAKLDTIITILLGLLILMYVICMALSSDVTE